MNCPVFLPDATLCNQPVDASGLCETHREYRDKYQDGLGFNLIVKNEENCLARTLENIRPIADEIVVTDTGSSDRTVEIAEAYADKVLFHEWQDSFSEARNWSLQHSESQWVCWIDADEYLLNSPEEVLETLARCNGAMTLICAMESEMPGGRMALHYLPKFFRNGSAYFQGIVHNQLISAQPAVATGLTFRHTGYNESPEIMAKKYARTVRLLRKQLDEDPDNTFAIMNLVRVLWNEQAYAEVAELTERGLALETGPTHIRQMLLFNRFMLMFEEDAAAAGEILQEGLAINPHNTDFLFMRADYAYRCGNWVDVILAMRAYQAEKADPATSVYRQDLLLDFWDIGTLGDEMLGEAYFKLGRYAEAREHFSVVLRGDQLPVASTQLPVKERTEEHNLEDCGTRENPDNQLPDKRRTEYTIRDDCGTREQLWRNYMACCEALGDVSAVAAARNQAIALGVAV